MNRAWNHVRECRARRFGAEHCSSFCSSFPFPVSDGMAADRQVIGMRERVMDRDRQGKDN
jgi:hypothetical protein